MSTPDPRPSARIAREATTRIEVGRHTVIAVSDGLISMMPTMLGTPESPTAAHDLLKDENGDLFMPIGCFVVPGEKNVLIDLGLGPDDFSGWPIELAGGQLLDSLARIGLRHEDIGIVALSHLHLDHVGWLGARGEAGELLFPNAEFVFGAADWEHFIDGEPVYPLSESVRAALLELAEQDRVKLLDDDRQIAPGITRLAAPGHTPGHSVFAIHDGPSRALLLGDAITCPTQLTQADWDNTADVDPKLAKITRESYFRDLESDGAIGLGCHFPGLRAGRILSREWADQ